MLIRVLSPQSREKCIIGLDQAVDNFYFFNFVVFVEFVM